MEGSSPPEAQKTEARHITTKNPLFLKSADLYFENKRRPATEPKSKYNISKIFLNLEICQKMRSNISKYSKIKG